MLKFRLVGIPDVGDVPQGNTWGLTINFKSLIFITT